MVTITANEIKTKGVNAIKKILKTEDETVITERGRVSFVVMDMERYNLLREYELEIAYLETLKDIKDGNYFEGTIEEHMKRISDV